MVARFRCALAGRVLLGVPLENVDYTRIVLGLHLNYCTLFNLERVPAR